MTDYAKPRRRSDPKTHTPHYLDRFEVVGFEDDLVTKHKGAIEVAVRAIAERATPGKVIAVHVHDAPEPPTARILGSRNSPTATRGVQCDYRVVYSDGRPDAEPFSYYGDAYRHAALDVDPADITRNGTRARKPGPR